MADQAKLQLAHPEWGLPKAVLAAFAKKGLQQLYPWQAAALECGAAGNNLVYCAPTSGGKSLVAEVLMLARIHKAQQAMPRQNSRRTRQQAQPRGLLVLPYLSIVAEKASHLSVLLEDMKWRVQGYRGETEGQPLSNKGERIAICSIEKANMAINHLIQEKRLHELVSVVVDEAHMLADPNRGAALEMLLSKLVACRAVCSVQIVAMSATMTGLDSLSAWLNAHLFLTNFRPVPLSEHVVFQGTVFIKAGMQGGAAAADDCPLVEQRRLPGKSGSHDKAAEQENLLALVAEVAVEQHSTLVFCASRHAAESCARLLAKQLGRLIGPPTASQAAARSELVEQLRIALAGYSNQDLEHMMAAGVAYHHAGLTHQERGVVEDGYRSGALLVLTATSTLAAGVNLPARRVILRTLWQGVGPVGRAQYLQMVGRAGRAGQSPVGESFLLGQGKAGCTTQGEWQAICKLVAAPLPALTSQLVERSQPGEQGSGDGKAAGSGRPHQATGSGIAQPAAAAQPAGSGASKGAGSGRQAAQSDTKPVEDGSQQEEAVKVAQPMLQQLLLHAIATGIVSTGQSVQGLLMSTLAYQQVPFDELSAAARAALTALRARKLLSLRPDSSTGPSHWALTPLGSAVVASTLPPDLGLLLHNRLSDVMCGMVMCGHVHLLYELQPEPLFAIYDWKQWCRMTKEFTPAHWRVAEAVGVQQSYLDRRLAGMRGSRDVDAKHARLAAAWLMDQVVADAGRLQALEAAWGQADSLTQRGISRGQMQSWQSELSKTAAMAALLANSAGWWQLETLLAPLAAQAAAGVRPELLPLMEIQGMQPSHAAALHAAGYHRPELLVCASESEVAAALAAKLQRSARKRSKDNDNRGPSNIGSSYASRTLVVRAAKSLLEAARRHTVLKAAANAADAESNGGQVPRQLLAKPVGGQAVLHQAWPRQEDPLLQQLLDGWQLQPSFSFAVVLDQQGTARSSNTLQSPADGAGATAEAGGPGWLLRCPLPTALVLSWADREAAVLHLPSSPAAQEPVCARVWAVVKEVFADTTRSATCWCPAAAIAAFSAAGIQCRLTIDDPRAAFALWQPRAFEQVAEQHEQQHQQQQQGQQPQQQQQTEQDDSWEAAGMLRAAQTAVLGSGYRLLMPLVDGKLAAAGRAALLARALMPSLRAILVQQRLYEAYESVERPLQHMLASVRSTGVRVAVAAVQAQLQQFGWQRACLQQHATQLMNASNRLDISTPSHIHVLLDQLRLGTARNDKEQQSVPSCLQQAVRRALGQNQQQCLPLVRCLLTYWQIADQEQQLKCLLKHAPSSHASDSMSVGINPLPRAAALSGGLLAGLPSDLDCLLARVLTPHLPVMAAEGSLDDFGVTSLSAPMPVLMVLPQQPSQQQQQQQQAGQSQPLLQQFLGVLCSISQLHPSCTNDLQLPLHDYSNAGGCRQVGCVRHWCIATQSVREVQLSMSMLHSVIDQAAGRACGSIAYAPGTLSMLPSIQPSRQGHTFIGLSLEHLPLVVLAGVAGDEVLLAALSQPDPVAAAAAHWLQHSGLQASTMSQLLANVVGGAIDGTPVPQLDAQRALFSVAVDALVHGRKPSVQRKLLGVEQQSVNLSESLLNAFPGLVAWRNAALEGCRQTGHLCTVLRKIPFKLPSAGSNSSSAEARAVKEAERIAGSMLLLGSCGDIERLAAAAVYRCCSSCLECSVVLCGPCMLVLDAPSASALAILKSTALEVTAKLRDALGLAAQVRLPFKWWWGTSLDAMQANHFCA